MKCFGNAADAQDELGREALLHDAPQRISHSKQAVVLAGLADVGKMTIISSTIGELSFLQLVVLHLDTAVVVRILDSSGMAPG